MILDMRSDPRAAQTVKAQLRLRQMVLDGQLKDLAVDPGELTELFPVLNLPRRDFFIAGAAMRRRRVSRYLR